MNVQVNNFYVLCVVFSNLAVTATNTELSAIFLLDLLSRVSFVKSARRSSLVNCFNLIVMLLNDSLILFYLVI